MATPADDDASTTDSSDNFASDAGGSVFEHSSPPAGRSSRPDLILPSEDEHDESSSDDEPDRPNRWTGPESTWRTYTEAERDLAASLTKQHAEDLSAHLYNAHALKARLSDPNTAADAKPYLGKKRWIKRNEDGSYPWLPKASWTAWPLRPEDVPRMGERFGVPASDLLGGEEDKGMMRKEESWRPGAEMEGEVLAAMLRVAKERFRERKWEGTGRSVADGPVEQDRDVVMKGESGADDDDDDEGDDDGIEVRKRYVLPDFIADDNEAAEILQPMVSHTMSKLDDLLTGLQTSRQGRQSASRATSRFASRKRKSRLVSHATSRSTKRSRSNAHFPEDADDDDDKTGGSGTEHDNDINNDTRDSSTAPKRQPKLNPRDWSELLAIACLVGWDANVLERTTRRCADLFGEHVHMLPVNRDDPVETPGEGTNPGQSADTIPHEGDAGGEDFVVKDEQNEVTWLYCPVETCKRVHEPFQRAWRWREHLKRVHKYNKAQIARAEAQARADS